MSAYDTNNIFAKILRGEFPCYKVYEDEHVLAFLDIMPRAPGHTLVIPKAPARNILDIKPDDYAHAAPGEPQGRRQGAGRQRDQADRGAGVDCRLKPAAPSPASGLLATARRVAAWRCAFRSAKGRARARPRVGRKRRGPTDKVGRCRPRALRSRAP